MDLATQVKEGLLSMQEELAKTTPALPTLLRTIHAQLKKDPEVVTLLSEDECNVLVEGLKEFTKIEIATVAVKKAPKTSLKSTGLSDL